jgi:peptidoglycan/xylan/chitin deacetylase (PgdA/CDA1 family)
MFVVHSVTDTYSTNVGPKEDWMSVKDFRHSIEQLRKRYTFISLEEAMNHLCHDKIRTRNYAVLSADDGYRSVYDQLPWLIEYKIPIALLINPKYLDGKSYSNHLWTFVHEANPELTKAEFVKGRYMTATDLQSITSPLVSIGSHGYEHTDNGQMSESEFRAYMEQTKAGIEKYHAFVPFHAYPWGIYSKTSDKVLKEMGIIPMRADGAYNINDFRQIHREYLPKIDW